MQPNFTQVNMVTKYGSALIVGTYHIGPQEPEDAEKAQSEMENFTVKENELTDEEMIERLKSKGYFTLNREQFRQLRLKCSAYDDIRKKIKGVEDGLKA